LALPRRDGILKTAKMRPWRKEFQGERSLLPRKKKAPVLEIHREGVSLLGFTKEVWLIQLFSGQATRREEKNYQCAETGGTTKLSRKEIEGAGKPLLNS